MAVHDITDASPELLALIEAARRGEEVTLVRGGEVMAKVVGVAPESPMERVFGSMAGEIWMAPDFDEWPADMAEAFGMREPG